MPLARRLPPPIASQQARQDQARAYGCIYCRMLDCFCPLEVEIHHLTENGRTLSHDHTTAACAYHHRGVCLPRWTKAAMLLWYGPSIAGGSKPFTERFGDNAAQLLYQNAAIGCTDVAVRYRKPYKPPADRSKPDPDPLSLGRMRSAWKKGPAKVSRTGKPDKIIDRSEAR